MWSIPHNPGVNKIAMKDIKNLLNWRMHVLCILTFITFFCLFGDSENLLVLLGTKAMAFLTGYVLYKLLNRWDAQGKLFDLDDFLTPKK